MDMKTNMNNSDNSETNEPKEVPFKKWDEFVSDLNKGWLDFRKSLEEESKKNLEEFEKSKEKVDKFFQDVRKDWENKVEHWKSEIERKNLETKQQWEATTQKIQRDMEQWKKQRREDFKEGVKLWNRFWIKSSYAFLLFMIPILIIIIIIGWILTNIFEISF